MDTNNSLVALESHQIQESTFPPNCPVYIYEKYNETETQCVGNGIVTRVMLQCVPKVEMFFEVDTKNDLKLVNAEDLRYRTHCPVNVKVNDEIMEGVVIGICDVPLNARCNEGTIDGSTHCNFWYSIHLCDTLEELPILHQVIPSNVSHRQTQRTDSNTSGSKKSGGVQVREGIKIEDNGNSEGTYPATEKKSQSSAQSLTEESSLGSQSQDQEILNNKLETTSKAIWTPPQSNERFSHSIRDRVRRNTRPKGGYVSSDVLCSKVEQRQKTVRSPTRRENSHSSDWRLTPPSSLDCNQTTIYSDRIYHWCRHCNNSEGMWTQHNEQDHPILAHKNRFYRSFMFSELLQYGNVLSIIMKYKDEAPLSCNDKNTPMCIFFHARGICKKGAKCRSRIDHTDVPKYKLESLLNWCKRAYFGTGTSENRERKRRRI